MQLLLFPWESLNEEEKRVIYTEIRGCYWWLRNLRRWRGSQGSKRRYYRKIEAKKKHLQLAGVSKREILDFLSCCRLQCSGNKQPFKPCPYCPK